ncbi:MAG: hypothetical protein MH472_08890 [Bacteroidia bacterium]|nr:hypothetical protein [Bacteroidia bacterium]
MNKFLSFLIFLSVLSAVKCGRKQIKHYSGNVVFEQNFESTPLGSLSISQIKNDFNNPKFLWGYLDRLNFLLGLKGNTPEIVFDESRCLKAIIPANTAGPINGQQWAVNLDSNYNSLILSYKVKFDSSFCFVKGGKLPGLAGGFANTGGKKPTGSDGWSARLMFWSEGKLCFWLYHKNQNGKFGDSIFFKTDSSYFKFLPNKWYVIKQEILINDLNKNNGVLRGYIDDKLYVYRDNITYSDSRSLKIDKFIFSVFLGGDDESYTSNKKEFLYIDDIKISRN